MFIRRRTDEETNEVRAVPMDDLKDPEDDRERTSPAPMDNVRYITH